MNLNHFFFFSIIYLLLKLINGRYVENDDNHYLIYVNNTYGMIPENNGYQKRQEPQQFVNLVMEEIQQLIINNKNKYKNLEELEGLEEKNKGIKKRNNSSEIKYVYQISSLDDISVLSSYFSYDINEKVNTIPGVLGSEPKRIIKMVSPSERSIPIEGNKVKREYINEGEKNDDNINKIKLETGWKDVEIRKNSDLHLSILSQGYFNDTGDYDSNYYYPKSAGEDIDIYVIDTGFDFRNPEFTNKEGEVKCLGIIKKGIFTESESDDHCLYDIYDYEMYHGTNISNCAAGLNHGVANKANIYGLVLDDEIITYQGAISTELFILAFDYILNDIPMRPHKSIINMSWGDSIPIDDHLYIDYLQKIFEKFNEKGIVVITSAGNENEPVIDSEMEYIDLPCALDNVLCVGAVDSSTYDSFYEKAYFSNFGDQVNIYGPGYINVEHDVHIVSGTSYASPVVAGVAATVMSEHPEIQFNTKFMIDYLTKNGIKDVISGIPEGNNVLVNNGKKSINSELFNQNGEIATIDSTFDSGYKSNTPKVFNHAIKKYLIIIKYLILIKIIMDIR